MLKLPVSIVEDNIDFRWVMESYIGESEGFYVNYSYSSVEELRENIEEDNARIFLMDIDLPGASGIEGIKLLKKQKKQIDIIVVTIFENSETVFNALRSGASGYLTKTIEESELLKALSESIDGGAPMSMKIAKMVVQSFNRNINTPLTERETEVLACMVKGMSYNSAAENLFISKETVKYHIKNIYSKLQVNSKEDAIRIARRDKLI
ncbi:MAG: response regulator transcription factor [Flavobacteriales bacterium]|nr:response regulator transcription factor [Flavobacteriales bacterium]